MESEIMMLEGASMGLTTEQGLKPPIVTTPFTPETSEGESSSDNEVETLWINEATNKVNDVCSKNRSPRLCTIFRVPKHIRQCDAQAYDPLIVPIGAYHHDPSQKSTMLDRKWRCVRYLLSRHGNPERASQLLVDCLLELKASDAMVRSCYSEELPNLEARKLAEIMLLDGCFIICHLLKYAKKEMEVMLDVKKEAEEGEMMGKEKREEEQGSGLGSGRVRGAQNDRKEKRKEVELRQCCLNVRELGLEIGEEEEIDSPLVAGLFANNSVLNDLLKLENQIPFFVIQLLFNKLRTSGDESIDLPKRALQLFDNIHPNKSESFQIESVGKIHHLLHLFHSSRGLSQAPVIITNANRVEWIPTATELTMAGVKFRRKKTAASFLDVTFKSGQMEIPSLQVHDYTCSLFQNLIAFEQCYADAKTYVTVYADFMDCIIDEAKDARLLDLKGIVVNGLSTDEAVADLFNKLCDQIYYPPDSNYLHSLFQDVNKHYYTKYHRWRASLMRDYFSNPWTIISAIAAALLLLLTIEQAIFAGISYLHPLKGLQG